MQNTLSSAAHLILMPCHFQVMQNFVTLQDPAELNLSEAESQSLLSAMQPYFEQEGLQLRYQTAQTWRLFLSEEHTEANWLCQAGQNLPQPKQVIGEDLRDHLPLHPILQRLQSEMQMLLYQHPVNEARESLGQPAINAFWIYPERPLIKAKTVWYKRWFLR